MFTLIQEFVLLSNSKRLKFITMDGVNPYESYMYARQNCLVYNSRKFLSLLIIFFIAIFLHIPDALLSSSSMFLTLTLLWQLLIAMTNDHISE